MPTAYHTIEFPLTAGPHTASIDFLPYGTRTLKVKVTNPDRVPGALVLRSEHLPERFGNDCFFSHEEGGADFRLSWGGGHERGACLQGRDKEILGKKIPVEECTPLVDSPPERPGDPPESFIYFNLTHTGGPIDQPRTLLLTVRPENDPQSAPLFKLPVTLTPPAVTDPARFDPNTLTLTGQRVPTYIPRWWSPPNVVYPPTTPALPGLALRLAGQELEVRMSTRPGQAPADGKPIVKLRDNISFQDINKGRDVRAEVYHFTGNYFVLRVWFFWLWKAGLSTALDEIPDVERFDFVIDSQNHNIAYVASDTHWREAWAPAPPDECVEAQLGLFSGTVVEKLGRSDQESYVYWMMKHKSGVEHGDLPRVPSYLVQQVLETGAITADTLGPGIEAHVPYFVNCFPPEGENFVSSDPRNG